MCVLLLSVHYVDPKTSLERSRTFSKGTVVVTVLAQCHPQYVLAVCVARAETLRLSFLPPQSSVYMVSIYSRADTG